MRTSPRESRLSCRRDTRRSPGKPHRHRRVSQFKSFIDIFRNFLLGFAAIALFVGSFIIFNAFKITVAQRTRQLGLLRAVGASTTQVVGSVLLEAAIIGLIASLLGVVFGVGLAAFLRVGFNAVGAALPATSLEVKPQSIIVGLVAGMAVTVASALVPAWKASGVPPIAAMRNVQVTEAPRARPRSRSGLTGGGVALVLTGLLADLHGLAQRFALIGAGALLLFRGRSDAHPVHRSPSRPHPGRADGEDRAGRPASAARTPCAIHRARHRPPPRSRSASRWSRA